MTRVEPHLYSDTPIFRDMLYERGGRFPGTSDGEVELPLIYSPAPMLRLLSPSGRLMDRLAPVGTRAVIPVEPLDSERTQPISLADLTED